MKYSELEQQAKKSEDELYQALQKMTLEDLGTLFLEPLENYPYLNAILPSMPAEETQVAWTGTSGKALLVQNLYLFVLADEILF